MFCLEDGIEAINFLLIVTEGSEQRQLAPWILKGAVPNWIRGRLVGAVGTYVQGST